jgi:hypothetical protein
MELPIIDRKHFMELYEQEGLLSLSNIQMKNIDEIAKMKNINVTPMTFSEADNGKANISLDRENCQTCVAIIEARRRGLNVTSLSYTGMDNKFMYELGEKFESAYINPRNGKIATPSIVRGDNSFDKLLMRTEQKGRYAIGINATVDGKPVGHVVYAERFSNNDICFYDPQINQFVDLSRIDDLEYFEVLKIDKLLLNKSLISGICRAIK